MLTFHVLTLFPGMFASYLDESILARACQNQHIAIDLIDIRDYTTDRHRTADDAPYGGGGGMVMKVEPIARALDELRTRAVMDTTILLTPNGTPFSNDIAVDLSTCTHIALICGRYEGVDERVCDLFVDRELSIGDYVITGGELAAMIVMDASSRFVPGVLGNEESKNQDSLANGLLKYPQYTRPREFRGLEVPPILLCGDHARIDAWRTRMSLQRTRARRPDLLKRRGITPKEHKILEDDR